MYSQLHIDENNADFYIPYYQDKSETINCIIISFADKISVRINNLSKDIVNIINIIDYMQAKKIYTLEKAKVTPELRLLVNKVLNNYGNIDDKIEREYFEILFSYLNSEYLNNLGNVKKLN